MGWLIGLVVIAGVWLVAPGSTRWFAAAVLLVYVCVWALVALSQRERP